MILNKLHEIEFNLRLQITSFICAMALVTPLFTGSRFYEYFGVSDLSSIKLLYVFIGAACLAGFVIRAWGAAYLSSYVVMAKNANQDKLIVAGPFRFVRNPLYFGDILGAGAIGLALPIEGFLIMVVLLTIHSYLLARYEEKNMLLKHGDSYREFLKNVNRLVPSITPYKHSGYDEFVANCRPDWPDAIMSNIYFAGLGGAFLAAAFAGYSPRSLERCVYIYSIVVLTVWSVFYMIYYHPMHFTGGGAKNKNAKKTKKKRDCFMDVIMLAGGQAGPELDSVSERGYKALVKIKGEFMVNSTLKAFKESKLRAKLFLVAGDEIKSRVPHDYYDYFIREGSDILDNISKAFSHDKIDKNKKVVITSCDIPLISHEAVDNFIGYSQNSNYDAIYPIVEKSLYDARFKNTRRTWYYCKDGTYTGGNFICIKPAIFFKNKDIISGIFENRKNPLKIASLFGVKLLLKYKMGLASKKDALEAVFNIIKTPCAAFESKYAEIVFDIDKMSDYEISVKNFSDAS